MKTELVIFDLDGTLLNTIADLGNAVNHVLESRGLPRHAIPDYKRMVGHGMRNLVKSALPESCRDEEFISAFHDDFVAFYMTHIDCATLPYPGIVELVHSLDNKGVKLAVASNKNQDGVERLIRKFFPGIQFTAICGNGEQFPLKPDAALPEYIMKVAGTNKNNTLLVGDTETDIQTARNAGIKVIAVSWGFRSLEDIADADFVVDDAASIMDLV